MFAKLDHVGLVAYTIEEARKILGNQLGLSFQMPWRIQLAQEVAARLF